jgi:hypothetical protein
MYRVGLSPLELAPSSDVRRAMPRPPQFRPPGYEDEYDFDTVFYDCFASADGRQVVCVGPPLFNLEPVVFPALHTAFLDGIVSPDAMVGRLHRCQQFRFPRRADRIQMPGAVFRQADVSVQPNQCQLFRGKKVLLSKSKDNDLIWIADWVRFHAESQGCDAVLLYDNGSTLYRSDDLRETALMWPSWWTGHSNSGRRAGRGMSGTPTTANMRSSSTPGIAS